MKVRRYAPLIMLLVLLFSMSGLTMLRLGSWPSPLLEWGVFVLLVYCGWSAWEGAISVAGARSTKPREDRGSNEVYALAQGVTALSTVFWSRAPASPLFLVAGAAVLLGGLGLRVWAVRALGAMYSHRVRITEAHALVTTGPYRCIRHPAYAGMLLIHCGLALGFSSEVGAVALSTLLVPAILWRIYIEERALAALPGYTEFCSTRARLLPRVW